MAPESWRLTKARHLVKLLALAPRHRLHREQLIDHLWPDLDPPAASNNLHQALSAARRAISSVGADGHEILHLQQQWVSLGEPGMVWVDVVEFERHSRSQTIAEVRTAMELYGGELLPDDRYAEWAESRRESLRQLHRESVARIAQDCLDRGEWEDAHVLLSQLMHEDPVDEQAHQAMMRLYAETGQPQAAMRQFDTLARVLRAELDVAPSAESRDLADRIRQGETGRAGGTGSPSGSPPLTSRVPAPLSTFVGREEDLAALSQLLSQHRLVTLTGAGGCGKTRLALEMAVSGGVQFSGGVGFVELGPLERTATVDVEVARALHLRPGSNSGTDALIEAIGPHHVLLVLDNCEHVAAGAAALVEALLPACPHLTVLATSREPLRVAGERVRRVPPLELPDLGATVRPGDLMRSEAGRLLLDRVTAADPTFVLDSTTATDAARIAVRLDGMPLALELAAARVNALTMAGVAHRLDDRFELLSGGGRTVLERHQTLEATVAWSFALLSPLEQSLFCRLAVLRGPFDIATASAVVAQPTVSDTAIAAVVADLVDKSMVVAQRGEGHEAFRLLETMRAYGLQELDRRGETTLALEAHAEWFCDLVEGATGVPSGPQRLHGLREMDRCHADLTAALGYLRSADVGRALWMTAQLWPYWLWFGHLGEGARLLEAVLDCGGAGWPEQRSRCWLGLFVLQIRNKGIMMPGMRDYLTRSLEESRRADSPRAVSTALLFDGIYLSMVQPDPAEAADDRFAAAQAVAEAAGLRAEAASAQHARAVLAARGRRVEQSRLLLQATLEHLSEDEGRAGSLMMLPASSLNISRRLGELWPVWEETLLPFHKASGPSALAFVRANMGSLERLAGDPVGARQHLEEAHTAYVAADDESGEGLVCARLGWLSLSLGELGEARRHLTTALAIFRTVGEARGAMMALLGMSRVAVESGDSARAAECHEQAERAAREQGDRPALGAALTVRSLVAVMNEDTAGAVAAIHQARDIQISIGHHTSLGVVTLDLADAQWRHGDPAAAMKTAAEAVDMFDRVGIPDFAAVGRRVLARAQA